MTQNTSTAFKATYFGVAALILAGFMTLIYFMDVNNGSKRHHSEPDYEGEEDVNVFAGGHAAEAPEVFEETPAAAPAAAVAEPEAAPAAVGSDYSRLVSSTYLTPEFIAGLDKSERRILRNTIYAVHGRRFKSADLREFFSRFKWYTPTCDEVPQNAFNDYETQNLRLILSYE